MFKLGRGKMVKRMAAGVMAGVVCFGTFSSVIPCSAATIKATRTDSLIYGKLTANKGTVLKIVLDYDETNKSKPYNIKSNYVQSITVGDYDSVSCSRNVTSGYKYTFLSATGYRNGTLIALAGV